ADRAGGGGKVGEDLLFHAGMLFDLWYKVRDGTRRRRWLCRPVDEWLRPEVQALLRRGAACRCARTAGACQEILKWGGRCGPSRASTAWRDRKSTRLNSSH